MTEEPGAPSEPPRGATVELLLPGGEAVSLTGEAADASIVGSIATHGGRYEPSLLRALSTLVGPESVCIDVGANIGPVTLALSRLCPQGEVHAFEPAPDSFRYLQDNLTANGASNVDPHAVALSDRAGEATIHYNRQAAGAAFISDRLVDGVPQVVPVTTLDAWAASSSLRRLDLVKIDVEGSELQVLEGAAATIARFRPTLVVELNPVTLRRMQGRRPEELFRRLRRCYGPLGHLALVPEDGPMVPVATFAQVRRHLARSGVCNLVCSPRLLLPGRHPGVAGPAAALREAVGTRLRWNRFVLPPWAAVVEPKVLLRADHAGAGPLGSVTGRPGDRVGVRLVLANRGRVAIVGRAPRLAVSVRVVWIDAEGHHRVDDRSRVPAPALRPGAMGSVRLPLVLPDRPGRYTARVTLFQEDMAWFFDLDPSNCCEIDVEVVGEAPSRDDQKVPEAI
jgi:FkbM family methyltransferase